MKTLLPADYEYVFAYFGKEVRLRYEGSLERLVRDCHYIDPNEYFPPIYVDTPLVVYLETVLYGVFLPKYWPSIEKHPTLGVL